MYKTVVKAVSCGVQVAVVAHCTFEYLFDFVLCSGPSMEPTLYQNNVLVADRLTPRFGDIRRGDVIVAKNPNKPSQLICKRVIGLSGDLIRAQDTGTDTFLSPNPEDTAVIVAEEKNTSSLSRKNAIKFKDVLIPRGHVWIEGDNSANSSDSRHYGPIPQGLVVSKIIFRLYPFTDFGYI